MKEELLANGWTNKGHTYFKKKRIGFDLDVILTYNCGFILYCDVRIKGVVYRISESFLKYDIDYDYFKNMCNQIYKDGIRAVFDKDIV